MRTIDMLSPYDGSNGTARQGNSGSDIVLSRQRAANTSRAIGDLIYGVHYDALFDSYSINESSSEAEIERYYSTAVSIPHVARGRFIA